MFLPLLRTLVRHDLFFLHLCPDAPTTPAIHESLPSPLSSCQLVKSSWNPTFAIKRYLCPQRLRRRFGYLPSSTSPGLKMKHTHASPSLFLPLSYSILGKFPKNLCMHVLPFILQTVLLASQPFPRTYWPLHCQISSIHRTKISHWDLTQTMHRRGEMQALSLVSTSSWSSHIWESGSHPWRGAMTLIFCDPPNPLAQFCQNDLSNFSGYFFGQKSSTRIIKKYVECYHGLNFLFWYHLL